MERVSDDHNCKIKKGQIQELWGLRLRSLPGRLLPLHLLTIHRQKLIQLGEELWGRRAVIFLPKDEADPLSRRRDCGERKNTAVHRLAVVPIGQRFGLRLPLLSRTLPVDLRRRWRRWDFHHDLLFFLLSVLFLFLFLLLVIVVVGHL